MGRYQRFQQGNTKTMEINKTFKTSEGTVKFQGELSQEEADFVIQVGLNWLLQQGALPFKMFEEEQLNDTDIAIPDEDTKAGH